MSADTMPDDHPSARGLGRHDRVWWLNTNRTLCTGQYVAPDGDEYVQVWEDGEGSPTRVYHSAISPACGALLRPGMCVVPIDGCGYDYYMATVVRHTSPDTLLVRLHEEPLTEEEAEDAAGEEWKKGPDTEIWERSECRRWLDVGEMQELCLHVSEANYHLRNSGLAPATPPGPVRELVAHGLWSCLPGFLVAWSSANAPHLTPGTWGADGEIPMTLTVTWRDVPRVRVWRDRLGVFWAASCSTGRWKPLSDHPIHVIRAVRDIALAVT